MIPADDIARLLTITRPGERVSYSVAGDTYTILITGEATAGRYAVIDMHVPPGGGPDPHRHECEEMFLVISGEIELFFRDRHTTATAGIAVNVPANAPHMFKNLGGADARVLNVVAPAGLDAFFAEGGVRVAGPDAAPPASDVLQQQRKRLAEIAPRFGVEFLPPDTFAAMLAKAREGT